MKAERLPNEGISAYRKRTIKTRWWHEAIIDDMLMFPRCTTKERAARLKYHENYLSLVMNTDMFKALYEQRRAEFNQRLADNIQRKAGEAVDKALDIVITTLETKRDKIPFAELTEFTDRTLERLGYGVRGGAQLNLQINNTPVQPSITKEQLAEARKDLRAVEDQRQRVIEAKPIEPPSEPVEQPLDDHKDIV